MSKFFPFLDITRLQKIFQIHGQTTKPYFLKDITNLQNIFQIVAYQTLFVKECYNNFMSRNYFSRAGGPLFRNNGFSQHEHDHRLGSSHEDIKPSNHTDVLAIALLSLLVIVSIVVIYL